MSSRTPWKPSRSGRKRPRPPSGGGAASASSTDGASPHPSASASKATAVRTPSALLSRDVAQLSSELGMTVESVKDIRARVAESVINDGNAGHGRIAAEVRAGVTQFCIQEDGIEGGDGAKGSKMDRPAPLVPGAITGLDLCARALLLTNMSRAGNANRCLRSIRTGSSAMDHLLAPDGSYSSFGDGWSMPLPYQIPTDNSDGDATMNDDGAAAGGGVPFGMVTEFSGPPSSGKSQLALSIAAHAAFENGMRVHYIAGGGSRKALSRRLMAMCMSLARGAAPAANDGRPIDEGAAQSVALGALERVEVASVSNAHSLLAVLARIDKEEGSYSSGERRPDGSNGTLLVVDSASGCLGHHLMGDAAGPALVGQVALTLRHMARAHDGRLLRGNAANDAANDAEIVRPRRFAVVVTNGSVARREKEVPNQSKGTAGPASHKPAMGRYWHVSDVGVWLEGEARLDHGRAPPSFYEEGAVKGLSVMEEKGVRATLTNHYGKSCKFRRAEGAPAEKLAATFRIGAGGISDG